MPLGPRPERMKARARPVCREVPRKHPHLCGPRGPRAGEPRGFGCAPLQHAAPSPPVAIPAPRCGASHGVRGTQPWALVALGTPGDTQQRTDPCQAASLQGSPKSPLAPCSGSVGQTPPGCWGRAASPGASACCWEAWRADACPGLSQTTQKPVGRRRLTHSRVLEAEISRSSAGADVAAAACARGLGTGQRARRFGGQTLWLGQAEDGELPRGGRRCGRAVEKPRPHTTTCGKRWHQGKSWAVFWQLLYTHPQKGGGVCIADLGGERGAAGELAPCPPWVEMPLPGSSTRPGSAQLWGARDAQAQTSLQPGSDPTQCSAPSQTTGRAEGAGCRPGAKVSFPPPRFTVPQFPLCKPPTQVRGGGCLSQSQPGHRSPPLLSGLCGSPSTRRVLSQAQAGERGSAGSGGCAMVDPGTGDTAEGEPSVAPVELRAPSRRLPPGLPPPGKHRTSGPN